MSEIDSHTAGDGVVTVQGALDALQAERDAEWPIERLQANAALRRSIELAADRAGFVKAGDVVAPFTLEEVDGGKVVLEELTQTGPVVLIFFRFAGCPACNAAMPAYNATLAPALAELGAHLVAISPQAPEALGEIKHRHGFTFPVASDPEGIVIGRFGIGFSPDEEDRARQREAGNDLGATLGTGRWELPYPTVVVIDQSSVVRFADIHPDWMVRTEAATVIDAVRALG